MWNGRMSIVRGDRVDAGVDIACRRQKMERLAGLLRSQCTAICTLFGVDPALFAAVNQVWLRTVVALFRCVRVSRTQSPCILVEFTHVPQELAATAVDSQQPEFPGTVGQIDMLVERKLNSWLTLQLSLVIIHYALRSAETCAVFSLVLTERASRWIRAPLRLVDVLRGVLTGKIPLIAEVSVLASTSAR
jgi:hypothetical protein